MKLFWGFFFFGSCFKAAAVVLISLLHSSSLQEVWLREEMLDFVALFYSCLFITRWRLRCIVVVVVVVIIITVEKGKH